VETCEQSGECVVVPGAKGEDENSAPPMRLRAASELTTAKSGRFYYFSEAWQVKKKATAGELMNIFKADAGAEGQIYARRMLEPLKLSGLRDAEPGLKLADEN
jgi:hypothetical protein